MTGASSAWSRLVHDAFAQDLENFECRLNIMDDDHVIVTLMASLQTS